MKFHIFAGSGVATAVAVVNVFWFCLLVLVGRCACTAFSFPRVMTMMRNRWNCGRLHTNPLLLHENIHCHHIHIHRTQFSVWSVGSKWHGYESSRSPIVLQLSGNPNNKNGETTGNNDDDSCGTTDSSMKPRSIESLQEEFKKGGWNSKENCTVFVKDLLHATRVADNNGDFATRDQLRALKGFSQPPSREDLVLFIETLKGIIAEARKLTEGSIPEGETGKAEQEEASIGREHQGKKTKGKEPKGKKSTVKNLKKTGRNNSLLPNATTHDPIGVASSATLLANINDTTPVATTREPLGTDVSILDQIKNGHWEFKNENSKLLFKDIFYTLQKAYNNDDIATISQLLHWDKGGIPPPSKKVLATFIEGLCIMLGEESSMAEQVKSTPKEHDGKQKSETQEKGAVEREQMHDTNIGNRKGPLV